MASDNISLCMHPAYHHEQDRSNVDVVGWVKVISDAQVQSHDEQADEDLVSNTGPHVVRVHVVAARAVLEGGKDRTECEGRESGWVLVWEGVGRVDNALKVYAILVCTLEPPCRHDCDKPSPLTLIRVLSAHHQGVTVELVVASSFLTSSLISLWDSESR